MQIRKAYASVLTTNKEDFPDVQMLQGNQEENVEFS